MRGLSLLPVLLIVACGGGGGGDDPAVDLNGWWELAGRDTGSGEDYQVTLIVPVEHTDSTVVFDLRTHTLEEGVLLGGDPSLSDPNRSEWTLSVLSNDLLEGQRVSFSEGVAGGSADIRMRRVDPPDGTLVANGVLDGTPLALHSTTAFAQSYADADRPVFALYVHDLHPRSVTALALQWDLPSQPDVGTYPLGGSLSAAQFLTSTDTHPALAGGVEILASSAPHIRGAFELTFGGGETVAGTFDVDIQLQN